MTFPRKWKNLILTQADRLAPRVHGLSCCYDKDVGHLIIFYLLCIAVIHSGIHEHLLYARHYLGFGDIEVNQAQCLILTRVKEAYELVSFVLGPSLYSPST